MSTASERIVVQVTSLQKRAIARTAKQFGLNVSELIRQAVQGYIPAANADQILALLGQVDASTQQANTAMDDALAFVAASNKRIEAMSQERRR